MKGRAWKARFKSGDEHYNTCHGVDDHETTICGKQLDETWIYDQSCADNITCRQCLRNINGWINDTKQGP